MLTRLKNKPVLTLIWVGFLGVRFEVRRGKINPRLKLVRIMLETSNLARSSHPFVVSENISFNAKAPLTLLMSAFLEKKLRFLSKKVPVLKAIV